jgi:hypothetical protein
MRDRLSCPSKFAAYVAPALALLLSVTTAAIADLKPTTVPSSVVVPALTGPFNWVDRGPLVNAHVVDDTRKVVSVKDPSVVFYQGRWHIYATYGREFGENDGRWGMVYFNFTDWKDADKAEQVVLDKFPQFSGYACAPQVFYFEPQKLWYLVYQTQNPSYSTTTDLSKPETWTKPRNFYDHDLKNMGLDYWVICNDTHAYLFFTDDKGDFSRARTTLAEFPNGFDEPVVVLKDPVARELFEGGATYHIKGTNQYLTIIEAANQNWTRYYKAFIADGLDGEWRPLAAEWGNSFADDTRVRSQDGKPLWSKGISHGELLRDGYDQTLTIDPANLNLLYQGLHPGWDPKLNYIRLPYQLGILHREILPGERPKQVSTPTKNASGEK